MRLYNFTNERHGLENILRRRVKIARIRDLNDPFEFFALKLRTKVERRYMRRRKDEIDQSYGVICFSDRWLDPLMWSHYGDRHRGICLGFDVAGARAIRYIKQLPDPRSMGYTALEEMTERQRMEMGFVKSDDWKYERENRLVVELATVDQDGDLYFKAFSEEMRLAEVIVGARCEIGEQVVIDALGDLHASVTRTKARLAFQTFEVVPQRDPSLWRPSVPSAGDGP